MKRFAIIATTILGMFASVGIASAADRPALGVSLAKSEASGAFVTGIYANSPASRVGLVAGDRIVTLNGKEVKSYQDVINIVGASEAHSRIEMLVERNGSKNMLSVRLGSASSVFQVERNTMAVARPRYSLSLEDAPYTAADIDDQHAFGD